MSWAGQLWKQYDPINKIIFPGVGSKPTYNERGTELRNEAPKLRGRRRPRSPRVERVASSRPETTDSTNTAFDFFRCFSQTQNAFAKDHTRVTPTRFSDATRVRSFFSRVGRRFRDIFFFLVSAHFYATTHTRPLHPGAQANLSWASCRSATSSTRR